MNSNDCFIVSTQQQCFVWCGKGSTGDEREMAKSIAKSRSDPLIISEGELNNFIIYLKKVSLFSMLINFILNLTFGLFMF